MATVWEDIENIYKWARGNHKNRERNLFISKCMIRTMPPTTYEYKLGAEMNTREDFELFCSNKGWAANYIGDGQFQSHSVQFAYEAWQACAANYEAELLKRDALIAEKDEALWLANEHMKLHIGHYEINNVSETVKHALALTPDSVRLVEVGEAEEYDEKDGLTSALLDGEKAQHGTKLYTIVEGESE